MDFEDSPEQAQYRKKAAAWLKDNAPAYVIDKNPLDMLEGEDSSDVSLVEKSKAWQARKADAGWACLSWPKEYGGQALKAPLSIVWGQEEGKYNLPVGLFSIGHGMCGPTVIAHGTKEQKERFIEPLLRGDEIWCQLFSEPTAGSDLAGLRTSAVKDGDDWIINGQKVWVTGAQHSDWGIMVARSDPGAHKHKGLTFFILDMHAEGIEIRPIRQITGASSFNEVFFTDVRIPDKHRLDAVGNGWAVSLTTLMNERMSIGTGTGGLGGSATMGSAAMIKLARETYLNDAPAIENGDVRSRIADIYTQSKGLQYTGYRIMTALMKGGMPGPEASATKLIMTKLMAEVAALGMELQGGAGSLLEKDSTLNDAQWQKLYLITPALRIAGGSDEILRNIIGERVLGLPRDMRADRGIPFKDIPTGKA